jgi:hypothetical protein
LRNFNSAVKLISMKKFTFILALALVFASCSKEGLGGDATLLVTPEHHGDPIPSTAAYRDTVFIKFNAKEVPENPTQDYDAMFVGEVGATHVHCSGLKWGDYSVYITGYDTAFSDRVVGGLHIKIKRKERDQEISLTIPVAED